LLEALLRQGHVPAGLTAEPAFLAGLVLQLPFAFTFARFQAPRSNGLISDLVGIT
jgi:hypothetical protein